MILWTSCSHQSCGERSVLLPSNPQDNSLVGDSRVLSYHSPLEIKIFADNQKKVKLALKKMFIHLHFLYNWRVPYSFMSYVLYYKIPYYSGTLIYDSVYGHLVSTHGLFLSFCLSTLCTYSLIVHSELITFLCINLIWRIYIL